MARPTKQPHERREARFNLRFTDAEKAYVETQARAAGLDPAEYLRRRALGYHVPPAQSRADALLLTKINRVGLELHAIGINVNQLARAVHTDRGFHGRWETAYERLEATRADLSAVLEQLASDP